MTKLAHETKLRWIRRVLADRANAGLSLTSTDTLRDLIYRAGGPWTSREQLNSVGRKLGEDGELLWPEDRHTDKRRVHYTSSQWTVCEGE